MRYLFFIFILILSCAPRTSYYLIPSIPQYAVYPVNWERAWNAVVEVLAEEGHPIKLLNKDSRYLNTDWEIIQTDFYLYASAPRKDLHYEARMKLYAYLSALDTTTTKVKITIHYEGWNGKDWEPMLTTGVQEKALYQRIAEVLKVRDSYKLVSKKWIGLILKPGEEGPEVINVAVGSPAQKAGFLTEDILLEWNETPIESIDHFQKFVQNARSGETVYVKVKRYKSSGFSRIITLKLVIP